MSTPAPCFMVRLGDKTVRVPNVQGHPDVFSVSQFTLEPPRWVSDEDASECGICQARFSPVRRKHHCRHCGRIFCAKCCSHKVALPHLGMNSSERVCDACKPIAEPIAKALGSNLTQRLVGVQILIDYIQNPDKVALFVEAGGLQTLIHLLRFEDKNGLWSIICSGILHLTTYGTLQSAVLGAGLVKALHKVFCESDMVESKVLFDALNIVQSLCMSHEGRSAVIRDGALASITNMVASQSTRLAYLVLSVLAGLLLDPSTHEMVVIENKATIPRLYRYITSQDEQLQEVALRILGLLSQGNDLIKNTIGQEDAFNGHILAQVISSNPMNRQILINAACIVANLASSPNVQMMVTYLIDPLCGLLVRMGENTELACHLIRGLANFVTCEQHTLLVMPYIPYVMKALKCHEKLLRPHALRLIMRLMRFSWETPNRLLQEDLVEVLMAIAENKEVMDGIDISLAAVAPLISAP